MHIPQEHTLYLGNPRLVLAHTEGTKWNAHYPVGKSHVQFSLMRGNDVVNLYSGSHPYILIEESYIEFDVTFSARNSTKDLASIIEDAVLQNVARLFMGIDIVVSPGKETRMLGYHYSEIRASAPIKGLVYDKTAIIHGSWFIPKRLMRAS